MVGTAAPRTIYNDCGSERERERERQLRYPEPAPWLQVSIYSQILSDSLEFISEMAGIIDYEALPHCIGHNMHGSQLFRR